MDTIQTGWLGAFFMQEGWGAFGCRKRLLNKQRKDCGFQVVIGHETNVFLVDHAIGVYDEGGGDGSDATETASCYMGGIN